MSLPPEGPAQEVCACSQDKGTKFAEWPKLAWLAVLIWASTIFWLSSRTGPEIEEMNIFHVWDKAAHFLAFFCGAPALVCALRWTTHWSWKRVALTAAVVASLYGAGDEIHQLYTPKRSGADKYDWMADTLGGIAGTIVSIFAYARLERSHVSRRGTP